MDCEFQMKDIHATKNFLLLANSTDTEMHCVVNSTAHARGIVPQVAAVASSAAMICIVRRCAQNSWNCAALSQFREMCGLQPRPSRRWCMVLPCELAHRLPGRARFLHLRIGAARIAPMSWIDFVGYVAALTVLATFCMDTIVSLRGPAIASNVLFIVYGIAGQLYPVLLLHAVLLPVNVVKTGRQLKIPTRRVLLFKPSAILKARINAPL
jgi:hypothetical protein